MTHPFLLGIATGAMVAVAAPFVGVLVGALLHNRNLR